MFVKEELCIIMRDLNGDVCIPKRQEKQMIGPHFGSYMRPTNQNFRVPSTQKINRPAGSEGTMATICNNTL
jgi:hypothetical protein